MFLKKHYRPFCCFKSEALLNETANKNLLMLSLTSINSVQLLDKKCKILVFHVVYGNMQIKFYSPWLIIESVTPLSLD